MAMSKATQFKVLVGLGNPGSRYAHTRHNAGWLWLDAQFGADGYEFNKYGNYKFKHSSKDGDNYIIVKPQTFMNASGTAASYALRHFGITASQLIVVHDEVDLEIGEFKYSCGRGDGGHRGLKSINSHLGTKDYCRLRLGVRPIEASPQTKADTYVLNRFRDTELEPLDQISLSSIKS